MNPLSRSHRSQSASGRAEVRNKPEANRSGALPRDAAQASARPVRKVTFGGTTEHPIAARPLARRERNPGARAPQPGTQRAELPPDTQDHDVLVAWATKDNPQAQVRAQQLVVADHPDAQRQPVVRINSRQRAQPRAASAAQPSGAAPANALPAKPIATRRPRSQSAHRDPVLEAIMGAKDGQALNAVLNEIDPAALPAASRGRGRSPS